jgi:hypothetical protein
VVADRSRPEPGVDAAKEHVEIRLDDIGHPSPRSSLELSSRRSASLGQRRDAPPGTNANPP